MINIEMPNIDIEIIKKNNNTIKGKSPVGSIYGFEDYQDIPRNKPGIYMFFNNKNELLYCGKATGLRQRVRQHFYNEKSAIAAYRHEVYKIQVCFVEDAFEREIYETYVIHYLKAKYNRDKVFY